MTGQTDTHMNGIGQRRKILVVTDSERFGANTIDYAVNLAERMGSDILALNILKGFSGDLSLSDKSFRREALTREASRSADGFRVKGTPKGIQCEHMVKIGDKAESLESTLKSTRRIDFILWDSQDDWKEMMHGINLPIFSVMSNTSHSKGERTMGQQSITSKKSLSIKTVGFGLGTVALYAAVFANADAVAQYCARGGWYAALPIATVFAFSFIHGTFASSLWSLLGIEAVKKDALRQTEKKVLHQQKRTQKKQRVYAYVNPFHRI